MKWIRVGGKIRAFVIKGKIWVCLWVLQGSQHYPLGKRRRTPGGLGPGGIDFEWIRIALRFAPRRSRAGVWRTIQLRRGNSSVSPALPGPLLCLRWQRGAGLSPPPQAPSKISVPHPEYPKGDVKNNNAWSLFLIVLLLLNLMHLK